MKAVFCSEIQWRYLRTRKQQIVRRLPPDWEVLFLQTYVRGRQNTWWPRRDGRVTYVTVPVLKNLPGTRLPRLFAWRGVRALFNAAAAVWIHLLRMATGFGGGDAVLVVSNIYYGSLLRTMRRRAAVYDCNDNHLAFPGTPAWARTELERVVRQVDAVVVSLDLLREEVAAFAPRRVEEIGNGVDFELFDAAYRAPRIPALVDALPHPRIGYAGALADWIDAELLIDLARRFAPGSIVLVGPAVGAADPAAWTQHAANLHWFGAKPHDELPHWVAGMDVCLIPFRKTPLTRGVNPNKLWEYLALGKPVVATDFSPFLGTVRDVVRVGTDARGFAADVERALAEPDDAVMRRERARAHSWNEAARRMTELLVELAAAAPGASRL